MLEEMGTVIEADGEHVWVQTQARSACSHCGTGSCSTSVVAKLFGVKRNRLRLLNSLQASPGQRVVIGIPDQVLVAVSLRAYLLPLLGMLGAAALAGMLGMGELVQAITALAGLLTGLALTGRASNKGRLRERYAPELLRLATGPTFELGLTDLTRNRS
jgi:sigma-E factor negative regulatory protein RseC